MPELRLPRPLREYLEIASSEGERNERLKNAAMQCRDCRMTEMEAETLLLPLATLRDGLPEREAKATIHSMFSRPPRDVPRGVMVSAGKLASAFKPTVTALPPKKSTRYILCEDYKLPEGMSEPASTFLKHLFKEGEHIQLVCAENEEGGKEKVSTSWHTYNREKFIEIFERDFIKGDASRIWSQSEKHGVYFCVNPLGKTSPRRLYDNIADFRHCLIEFDSIPKEKQYQLIEQSRIPCAAVTDSGGKSIHAIVKVNARNLLEYRERVGILMDHFREYGVDPKTKDPTRLSRFPGVVRGDTGGTQKLLCLTIGAATFEEWYAERVSSSDELPDQMAIADLIAFDSKKDPNNLIGDRFLCKGSAFIVSGQSGIGKSSFGLQMLLCWAVGMDFFGIKAVRPLKVMVVQSENDLGDMAEAFKGITDGLLFTPYAMELLAKNLTIYRDTSHTGAEFISMLHSLIARDHPDVVLIDPLLAVVGDDICEAKVIGEFFRRGLNALMQVTGVVVIFMHHVPKPIRRENEKYQTNTDLSYAGSGSSDLTNWPRAVGVLRRLYNLDAFQFIMTKRQKRTGMINDDDEPTDTIELQHGKGQILWERMDKGMRVAWEMEKEAKKTHGKNGKKNGAKFHPPKFMHTPDRLKNLKSFLSENPKGTKTALCAKIGRLYNVGKNTAEETLEDLKEKKYVISDPIPGSKPGLQVETFSFTESSLEQDAILIEHGP